VPTLTEGSAVGPATAAVEAAPNEGISMIVQAHAVAALAYPQSTERVGRFLAAGDLDAAAATAVADQQAVLVRAGVAGITKQVAVQALSPVYGPARTRFAIRWLATGPAGPLFPALDGNLELYPAGDARTAISLTGCYEPPFGRSGAVVDRLVMRRVAEATLAEFLHDLVELVELVAGTHPVDTSGRFAESA
jgi:hypothetical protein